ncbi:secreted antigen 1 [Babesia divergens]|uniref:Secreted antigen 1 n=1 Tax=Babesia divergens TaxID=32595 RepID=A0AAD9GJ37_BABDI|nr:secreted antigen 1 [Babesia divergens]
MLFNCDGGMKTYSLGAWSGQNVNGSGGSGKDLNNWLTKVENLKPLTPGLISRGFLGSELKNSNDGSTVAPLIKNIIKHDNPGDFQKVLASLLFACPWDPSLLGHALCFLYKFCEKVGSDYLQEGGESFNQYKEEFERKFNGSFDEMQKRCNEVNNGLTPFTLGLGSSETHLSPVCQKNTGLFNDLWDDGKFEDYVKWLKENLEKIIEALEKLSTEHTTWTTHSFEHAYTAGPFRFGFVFKDNKWQNDMSHRKLQEPISKLTASLQSLQKSLENFSTGNPGATAGGVFTGLLGTGGLGAGAAYATNAFGFQNFISGLISSFLK